ncbi:hypothetical protein GLOIN_2v1673793 [Rhizophagus clarus]|uniref:K Homology domain-containing protein n=1 Tax=Rhizophagus clarus TaxID=94130 RepID=A0A8H3LQT6_9GLOM|nr:hypothetical protein GLOIN_2v1673793 [Rhizophagus clarus]
MSHFTKKPVTVIPIPQQLAKYMNIRKIREIESKSGAKVYVKNKNGERPLAHITGDGKQCEAAKTLIKEFIEKSHVIPTIGYTLLEVDILADVNKAKFQFIKFEGICINSSSNNKRVQYSVQLMEETKDDSELDVADLLDQKLEISPSGGGFATSEKLDSCLNEIYSQLSKADPTDSERREFRRGGKYFCTSFQQNAPQILEKMSLLEKRFKFKEDEVSEITSEDKGSIAIYFDQDSSRRKLKLHWNDEDRSWKITKYVRNINRIAILDLISGNEAPDCRFLLKTCYDLKVGNKLTEIIDEIQSKSSFKLRDEMWFRVEDFDGKLDKVEIRQTMSKRRFFNGSFQISIATIKQDSDGKLITQQTTSLKNRSWRSVENIDRNLSLHYDEQEISNTICETINFARDIVKVLS